MRNHRAYKLILGFIFILYLGCDPLPEREKFQRPDWLPGKLFTTVSVQENLSLFTECLQLCGLDTILNISGSWTVFAPDDEAVKQYLVENQYASLSDIPLDKLQKITRFHILQNPWTLEQLESLSANGWRTGEDGNASSYAYKRQTILNKPVEKYWIKRKNKKEMILNDSTIADDFKRVIVESRKYAPIFYDKYFAVSGISSEDYNFYFGRGYEAGNVYYAGAKILQSDIFAENGFVHIVDKVINPMLNGEELLERELPGESYKFFLEMVNWYYPTFVADMTATFNQYSVRMGGVVDTLWDLQYADLAFPLHNERIGFVGTNINETLVRHNGLFAPTDDSFREFIDDILTKSSGYPHWADYKSLPEDIIDIIFPRHFSSSPIYPSTDQYDQIFFQGGRFQQNEGDIIRKEFGSNCTFIGMDTYIPDKIFTTVTAPVFCRPSYSTFRRALIYSRTDDIIATYNGDLCFFPISDSDLSLDSSLMINWINRDANQYNFREYNRSMKQMQNLGRNTISGRIMNQVGTALPNGSANKEFIPTMGGNYIIWNNFDNTVQGNIPSTIGYNGSIEKICTPAFMPGPYEEGQTWSVDYWFNFRNSTMNSILSKYPKFFNLLDQAGFVNTSSKSIRFLDNNENYTVFAPSDEALNDYQVDTLSTVELEKFLKYHFLQGKMIFTDNKQFSDVYNTVGNVTLNIRTSPDMIEILNREGSTYVSIPEKEGVTNIMVSQGSVVTSVVHEIDQVLVY